jgi:hypothetical protein
MSLTGNYGRMQWQVTLFELMVETAEGKLDRLN